MGPGLYARKVYRAGQCPMYGEVHSKFFCTLHGQELWPQMPTNPFTEPFADRSPPGGTLGYFS
jgi:hypothetical protein